MIRCVLPTGFVNAKDLALGVLSYTKGLQKCSFAPPFHISLTSKAYQLRLLLYYYLVT